MSYPSPYELEAESLITLAFESEKVARIEEINSHKLSPSGSFNISSWTNQQAPIDMRITIRLKDSPSPPIIEEFHYTQSVFNYKPSIDAEKLISPSTSNNVGITKDISNEKVTQIRHITPTPKKAVEKIKLNTIRIENNCSAPRKSNALPTSYAVNHVLHRKMKSDAERVKVI
ncbi:unnamed protein product [Blepharisma stoltei]|uniref:Uncharacterized protein n=1 Tax=Blepharisma stoltei TaxID=1481888 RepID=A0AAU9IN26_9CILI|nr:unnamed protein product [Blepharisma stoltei]